MPSAVLVLEILSFQKIVWPNVHCYEERVPMLRSDIVVDAEKLTLDWPANSDLWARAHSGWDTALQNEKFIE